MSDFGKQEIKDGDEFGVQWTPEGVWVQDKKTGNIKFYPGEKDHFGCVISELVITPISARQSIESVKDLSK